jgi:pilus assembly protein CpaB
MVQVVNLLVTPDQAEQLSLASSQTIIQLILRNPMDHEVTKTPGTAVAHLFAGGRLQLPEPGDGVPRAPRVSAPRPAPQVMRELPPPPKKEVPFVMEIISGSKKGETKFESSKDGEGK